jgi:hypothetical protein
MAQIENPTRERILARIRNALKTPAPIHWTNEATHGMQPIFAPIPDALERFQRECAGNKTELIVTPNSSSEALETVLASLPPGEIFVREIVGFTRSKRYSLVQRGRSK